MEVKKKVNSFVQKHTVWATTSYSVSVLPGEPEPVGAPGRD